MELTAQVVNAAVVAAVGFLVWWGTRGQVKALADQMDRRFEQVEARFEQVDARFDQVEARFGQVESRIGDLVREVGATRSDLTQVALAVGAGPASERGSR